VVGEAMKDLKILSLHHHTTPNTQLLKQWCHSEEKLPLSPLLAPQAVALRFYLGGRSRLENSF
jgi:hypothetical protein